MFNLLLLGSERDGISKVSLNKIIVQSNGCKYSAAAVIGRI